jgi:hypothetical protein
MGLNQLCTICTSKVRADIEKRLDENVPLRKLALECGHSRAALSRHNRTHRVRARIEAYREARSDERRLVRITPEGVRDLFSGRLLRTGDELLPTEAEVQIRYEAAPTIETAKNRAPFLAPAERRSLLADQDPPAGDGQNRPN